MRSRWGGGARVAAGWAGPAALWAVAVLVVTPGAAAGEVLGAAPGAVAGTAAEEAHRASLPPSVAPDTVPSPEEVVRLLSGEATRDEGLRAVAARAISLPPDRATLWVQLMATVERTGVAAGTLAARAVVRADDRDAASGVGILLEGMDGDLPEEDRAPLVALAAHLAAEGTPDRAAELRRRLLREWPDALEAPEAQVELARHLLQGGGAGAREEAVELLEGLLVRRPNHPLAPEARRLRQEAARGAGAGSDGLR